ncbi:hypothetical protein V6N13_092162 [Hibiscus sabdariffa]|uniref:GDSL esterase/lipase n=1 Tax=Hibiscus sabdariffa TaxID=183260 RepID=A0ABR2QG27_9ROSI
MATFSSCSSLKQHFIILSFLFAIATGLHSPVTRRFTSIFSFGDSITDTGNLLAVSRSESRRLPSSAFPPNGRTFFHRPSGRRCDGRLIIDFLAEALGFPFLPPYYGSLEQLEHGANFAVAGASALNSSFLAERGIASRITNISLGLQLNNFKHFLPSLCSSSSDCKEVLRTSLVLMGEIGGNDYNHAIQQGINIEEIRDLVPLVVDIITSSINELIKLGAVTFLVPGNFPIGCSPSHLTRFQGSDKDKYDPSTGCLTWLNHLSEHHNKLLQEELEKLQNRHPDANIVYVDYYNSTMRLYRSPNQFGFTETLKACCGSGGPYNYNPSRSCAYPPLEQCCNDPSSHISWDGIHYTEATYRLLADVVFEDLMNTISSDHFVTKSKI